MDVSVQSGKRETSILLIGNGALRDYQFSRLGESRFSLDLADFGNQPDLPLLPQTSELVHLSYAESADKPGRGIQIIGDLGMPLDHYELKSSENNLTVLLFFQQTARAAESLRPAVSQQPPQKGGGYKAISASLPADPPLLSRHNFPGKQSVTGLHNAEDSQGMEAAPLLKKNYTGKPISFDFLDVDVRNALRLIADLTGANMVIEPDVTGKVTLKVNQVPWDQVLDLILIMNGLGKEQSGSVIRIAKQAKLQDEYGRQAEQIKARQELLEASKDVGEITTEYLTINYAPVADIAAKVTEAKSDKGKLTIDERTSLIIYSDYPLRIQNARHLIAKLDKATSQVMIEARIVTMSEDVTKNIGVSWDFQVGNNLANTSEDWQVNYGSDSPGSFLDFSLGKLIGGTMLQLDLQLSALENTSQSKIIAAPKVLTLNNVKAVVSQGTQIPYLERSGENVASTVFKDAVVELQVTPHITPDQKVRLEIEAKQDEPGATFNGQTGIDTRKIKTELLVEDGNIVVIGGVIRDTELEGLETTPGLSKIPLLGRLFKLETSRKTKNELLIFISPKIVELSGRKYAK